MDAKDSAAEKRLELFRDNLWFSMRRKEIADSIVECLMGISGRVKETQCKPKDGPSCKHYNPFIEADGSIFPCTNLPECGRLGFTPEKNRPWCCANCEPEDADIWRFMQTTTVD